MGYIFAIDHPHGVPAADLKGLIGGKAANLNTMVTELGLPVPPGFTISTAACNEFLGGGGWPRGLDTEMRTHMARVEAAVGRRFGDPADPLLVSVRSGAPVSMPGMMDTILNLGLNEASVEGLAASSGDAGFASDCRRRLDEMYRSIVGVEEVPGDPWEQLRGAVDAVFRSWNSARASRYRQQEGIPDDLGTAVTVQAMVFGNLEPDSGTGVLFTRNPATGEATLYGDVIFGAQGEDVVAGDHRTEPIAVLEERIPAAARELRECARRLEHHYADLCDIEFTIERRKLWMLQVRVGKRSPRAAVRIAADMAEDEAFPLTREQAVRRVAHLLTAPPTIQGDPPADAELLAVGVGASPGMASGEIAITAQAAADAADAGRSVILVRPETSPNDVHGMARSAGILTASGGLASHAAVVARGWGIPAVVGADAIRVGADGIRVDGRHLAPGEVISVDGAGGRVYAGEVTVEQRIVPEAETLIRWAAELGIELPGREGSETAHASAGTEQTTREEVLRTLLIKGYASPDTIAASMFCAGEHAAAVLDRLVADGLAEIAAGSFRLTEGGKTAASELVAADRAAWGVDQAAAALDGFLALDARVKETVTGWQMREVDGAQVLNDHADATHDGMVLDRLATLHADALDWIGPLAERLPRLDNYRARLQRAADSARNGDGAYVASPRVDSYHSVWFELHEDLIRLAGRTRAEEMAAGRA